MKFSVPVFLILLIVSCTTKYNPDITADELRNSIEYLASDSLKGRKAGSEGDLLTAEFIRGKFQDAGLELLFSDGFQPFGVVTEVALGEGNTFRFNNREYEVEAGFMPYSFSSNSEFSGEVVFAGYGMVFEDDSVSWDDYQGIDVSGKWVLVLKGDPEIDNPGSIYARYSDERTKVLTAVDNHAGGIIFTAGPVFSQEDELSPMFYDKNSSTYDIPVLQVTRLVADEILKVVGETVASLEEELNKLPKPRSFGVETEVTADVDVVQKKAETVNVAAILRGNDPELKNEYIVIGAHHDHLGMGGQGSGSRMPDTIAVHNGADDNASGVAAVIELAEKAAGENSNRRSLIFATFGAEETGLIGSRAFTAEPPVPLENITAMINFDMLGRLDTSSNSLSIGGTKTATEIEDLLNKYYPDYNLALSGEGTGPSDHSSFYLQGIPVFFISTGAHSDYHTPFDDAEFINYEGEKRILDNTYNLLSEITNRDEKLTFQEAGSIQRSGRGARYKVTLGIMPDFAGVEKRGLRVDAVTKEKPAYKAGMQKGDIITALDGKKVGNIYDYMNRLNTLETGRPVTVDVIRGD